MLVLMLVLALGCVEPPTVATARDPHCWYPGDTLARVRTLDASTNAQTSCFWMIATAKNCGASLVHTVSALSVGAC